MFFSLSFWQFRMICKARRIRISLPFLIWRVPLWIVDVTLHKVPIKITLIVPVKTFLKSTYKTFPTIGFLHEMFPPKRFLTIQFHQKNVCCHKTFPVFFTKRCLLNMFPAKKNVFFRSLHFLLQNWNMYSWKHLLK